MKFKGISVAKISNPLEVFDISSDRLTGTCHLPSSWELPLTEGLPLLTAFSNSNFPSTEHAQTCIPVGKLKWEKLIAFESGKS